MLQNDDEIRVLLADDHPMLMAGFAVALTSYRVHVVGQCKTPSDAVAMYDEQLPHVLVIDIRFGEGLTGFDAAKEVLKRHPKARIVFLSQFDQINLIREAYKVGGAAFVPKTASPEELALAIEKVHAGETFFLPSIADRLAALSVHGVASPMARLDTREVAVFTLMARGKTNQEIADDLALSVKTISNTSQGIKEKLGLSRQADITLLAVKFGLIQP